MDPRDVLRPVDATKAVLFRLGYGPLFGRRSLGVLTNENMNAKDNVYCATNRGGDLEFYNV